MKIINQHLGLPVICLETSERVGDVLRFIIDQVTGEIVAVAVQRQWYREPQGVAFADCTAFGQNVVLVSRSEALKPLPDIPGVSVHLEASNDARQRTAITEGGQLLGAVTDEAFDEGTGIVSHYRLDLFQDAGTGRTLYVPRTAFVTSSATVVILKDDVLTLASETLEPLPAPRSEPPARPEAASPRPAAEPQPAPREPAAPAAAQAAPPTAPPTAEPRLFAAPPEPEPRPEPRTELQPDYAEATIPIPDLAPAADEEPAPEEAAEAVEQEVRDKMEGHNRVMMALVIGKTAGATVSDDAGRVIVEQGETITMETAQAAAAAQRLYELWTNAQDAA